MDAVCSSADVQVVLCLYGRVFHDVFSPVYIRIHDRVVAQAEAFQCIVVERMFALSVVVVHFIE